MKIFVAILIQFFIISISFGQDWKEYRSNYAEFSVMVPAPMEMKEQMVETDLGKIEVLNFHCKVEEENPENHLYMLTTYVFPDSTIQWSDSITMDSLYNADIERSLLDLGGTLLYDENVRESGHAAKLWKVDYDNGIAKFKSFYIEDRYYLLQVYSTKEKSLNTSVNRYMQSF